MGRPRVSPFGIPSRLFPIQGQITGPLDMIPVVPDPTSRGARAWSILSRLPITEGEHAGRLIGDTAPPWQPRLTRLLFGHVDAVGMRLIREAFVSISKKNGKTSFAAALALTKLLLNEDQREQVVCLAANRLQARIAFDSMAAMIRADEELGERFEVIEHRHSIKYAATNSTATAVSAELASLVGFNPSLALVDELHLLGATPKGAKLVNQARTGNIGRREPLIVSISTAPIERSEGIFESTLTKARRVIAGEENDPHFFGWLCEVPKGLDPEDPANWHWSNPSLGYTLSLERLKSSMASAQSDPAALRDFRSQNLNIQPEETAGEDRWFSAKQWDAAADVTITLEALIADSVSICIGVDRGGLDDLTAICALCRAADGKILAWSHQWISRQGYDKRKAFVPYDDFIAAGELSLFDGGDGDLPGMAEVVELAAASEKLRLIGIDGYCAPGTAEAFADCGAEVQIVPQGWKLTPAISWLERALANDQLRHAGTAILKWNVTNAIVTRRGNAFEISKATAVGSGKIDGVAALLNAAAALLTATSADDNSPYADGRGLLIV
jgi:phage terminase large subunit-like protein